MAISYVTGSTAVGVSSMTLNGIQSDDLVLLFGSEGGNSNDLNAPDASWIQGSPLGLDNSGLPDTLFYYKFSTGTSVTATGLSTGGTPVYAMLSFRGVDQTTPFNQTASSTLGSGQPDPPSVTTTANGCMIVAVGYGDDDEDAVNVTPPSGFTLGPTDDSGDRGANVGGTTLATAYLLQSVAGTINPTTFQGSVLSDSNKSLTLALNPSNPTGVHIVQTGTHYTYTQGSSFSITGLTVNDFILLLGAADNVPSPISTPSGWTTGQSISNDIPDCIWAYTFATGTTLSVTVDGDTGGGNLFEAVGYVYIVFRGVNTSNPINNTSTVSTVTGGSTSINCNSVTTTVDNCWVIPIGFLDDVNTSSTVVPPSGYSTIINYDVPDDGGGSGGNAGATIMTSFLVKTTAGSEDPASYTFDYTNESNGLTIAIEPEPLPTPTPTPTNTVTPTLTPTPSSSPKAPIGIGDITLNEVRLYLEIGPTSSLQDCFAVAVDDYFDPVYKGSKDRLSNFQNYQIKAPTPTPTSTQTPTPSITPTNTVTPTNTPTPTPTPASGISFVKWGYHEEYLLGSSFTITGITSDDLVIVYGVSDGQDISVPTNFTQGGLEEGPPVRSEWFYNVSTSTSMTVSGLAGGTSGSSRVIYLWMVFRGVDTTSPIHGTTVVTDSTEAATTIDPPSITTTTNGCMIVILGALDDDSVANSVVQPSPYTFIGAAQVGNTGENVSGGTAMAAYWLQSTAGTENPSSFSHDGADGWTAHTIALEPA